MIPSAPGRGRAALALAALIMALWGVWLCSPYLIHGRFSYYRQHDTADSNAAFFTGQPEYARRGLAGYWTPSAATGVDARANGKHTMPLIDALFRLVPRWWLTGAWLAFETAAAAVGMLLLLHWRLGVAVLPAAAGAMAFSLMFGGPGAHSGFFLGYGTIVPGFPFLLLALTWAGGQVRSRASAAAALAGVVLACSASATIVAAALLLAAIWFAAIEPRATRRHAWVLAVCAIVFAIIAAPTFAAMAMHAADSHRTLWPRVPYGFASEADVWTSQRAAALALLRIHAPLLVVAAAGWLLGGFRSRAFTVILALTGIVILQIFLMVPIRAALRAAYEPFATFQLDRMNVFVPFLAAAAAALGLGQLFVIGRALASRPLRGAVLTIATVASLVMAGFVASRSMQVNTEREAARRAGSTYAAMFQRPALTALASATRDQQPFRIATFADANATAGQHPGYAWAYGFETADGYLNLYPARYHSFWGAVAKPTLDRSDTLREYFEHWGNRLYLFTAFLDAEKPRQASGGFNIALLALANVRYLVSAVELADPRLVLWPGVQGAPQWAAQTDVESDTVAPRVFVYENTAVLPRFFVTHQSRTFPSLRELIGGLERADAGELRRTVFLEAGEGPGADAVTASEPEPASNVRLLAYTADRIELEVTTPRAGTLVITNNFSRFWRAAIDQRPASLFRADGAFQGLSVPQGVSRVTLTYDPPYALPFWLRALLAAAAVGAFALAASWMQKRLAVRRGTARAWAVVAAAAAVIVVGAVALSARARQDVHPWADGGWPFRQALIIDNPKGMSTPLDLPVLIERDERDTAFWSHVQSAAMVHFSDAAGRPLASELEQFDLQNRRMSAWVLVPGLDMRGRTIYLNFGAGKADALPPSSVWSGSYAAVWHMNDDPQAVRVTDSSGSGHDGAFQPEMAGRWRVPGRIAGAARFNGVTDRATMPPSDAWPFYQDDWAIELWLKPVDQGQRNFSLLEYGPGPMLFHHRVANILKLERLEPAEDYSFHAASLTYGVWNHVALVRSGARIKVVINGALAEGRLGPEGFARMVHGVTIGGGFQGPLEGEMDEVRLLKGPALPGWGRAVYLAQTGGLVTAGAIDARGTRAP